MIVCLNPNNTVSSWHVGKDNSSQVCHWTTTQFYCSLWRAVFKQRLGRPVEGHCILLEVNPPGANPLNDILIALLFILWNFNGLLNIYVQAIPQSVSPSHNGWLWYHLSKNYASFVILEPLNYKCPDSERRMTTKFAFAHEKITRNKATWCETSLMCWTYICFANRNLYSPDSSWKVVHN